MTPFIRRLDEALGQMSRSREEPFGLLRIGAPVEFGVHYLPGCFVSFRQKYKDVRFDLTLGHPEQLMPKLEQGTLDIAFADLFSTRPEQHGKHGILNFDPVMDEALVLVASSRYHRTVMNRESSFEALGAADYVAYQRSAAALKSWFRYHFKKLPSPFNVAVTVESVQGVKASVEAGLGLGVLPHHLVATEMARREMVQFGNRKKPLSNKISLVRLLDKKPTLAEKKFVEHVKTRLK
jgi:DNA-binding transcriptional LysR family regulator